MVKLFLYTANSYHVLGRLVRIVLHLTQCTCSTKSPDCAIDHGNHMFSPEEGFRRHISGFSSILFAHPQTGSGSRLRAMCLLTFYQQPET